MEIGEKLKHAANIAMWKADQQKRLLESNSQVSKIKNEINRQKLTLADNAVSLYKENLLLAEELKMFCKDILKLQDQISEQVMLQQNIKNERPPGPQTNLAESHQEVFSNHPADTEGPVCPHCGYTVPVEAVFCANCGKEISTEEIQTQAEIKQCSNCGKDIPVEAEFCPECGHQDSQIN